MVTGRVTDLNNGGWAVDFEINQLLQVWVWDSDRQDILYMNIVYWSFNGEQ